MVLPRQRLSPATMRRPPFAFRDFWHSFFSCSRVYLVSSAGASLCSPMHPLHPAPICPDRVPVVGERPFGV